MPSSSFSTTPFAKKYKLLLNADHLEDSGARTSSEDDAVGNLQHGRRRWRERRVQLLLGLNIFQAIVLLVFFVLSWRERLHAIPALPYSPVYEAVRYTMMRFARNETFHGDAETAPELDDAWEYLVGPSAGHIQIPANEARSLAPSLELYYKPGTYMYGVAMFHQLHCLDVLRRSYYPDHYFPGRTAKELLMHKNHCLDYLRQSIMCSGDVSLDHWFNYTFTDPSFDPTLSQSPSSINWQDAWSPIYRNMTPKERSKAAPLMWDTVHQCRDYDAIFQWVKERQLVDDAYFKEFNRTKDVF